MLKPQSSPSAQPQARAFRFKKADESEMERCFLFGFFFWWLDALKSFSLSKVSKACVHAAAWPRVKGDFGECEDGQY